MRLIAIARKKLTANLIRNKMITEINQRRKENRDLKKAYIKNQQTEIRNWIDNMQGCLLWMDAAKPEEILNLMQDMDILKAKVFELGT
jgi:hypothetical protein